MTLRAIRAKDFTDSGDYLVVDDAQRTVAFIYRDPESHEWYEIPETNRHYTECWLGSTKKDALATLVRHGRDVGGESNRAGRVAKPMDSMTEVLLTVLAISQSGYAGPLSHAIPSRLQSALRRAREAGFVYVDDAGPYLEDEGAVELQRRGFGGSVFSNNRGGESNLTGRRSDANRSDAQVKFGDYDLHYNARPHLNEWDVEAYAPGWKMAGFAQFVGVREWRTNEETGRDTSDVVALKGWNVEVGPAHRRKGLARAMYAFAQRSSGMKIQGGDFQTAEGKAFRSSTNDSNRAGANVPLGRLWAWQPKLREAIVDVAEGRLSMSTDDPIRVSRLDSPRGHFFIFDGHHRAIEAVQRGDRTIRIEVDQYVPRIERSGGAYADIVANKVPVVALVQASNRAGGDWPVEQCAGCNEDVVLKRPRKGMDRDDYFVLCSACMRKAREHRKKHPKPPLAQTTPVVPTPPVVCPDCRGTGVTITGHRCFCTI